MSEKWIPINVRPMDEEEREKWTALLGYELTDEAVIYTGLPEDGDKVLICTEYGDVRIDTFLYDGEAFCFEDWEDIDGIIAWMPLPEPYGEEEEDE